MLETLIADFRVIFERDPAARNWLEVLFCYPGLQALLMHRFAHRLYQMRLPFLPRLISHLARFLTGIEIHPGAQIGSGVFIDHGMGVVIGETAIVGNYALIYQGVTLGGTGKESGKRHPTLGENVVVGAGAKVLGNLNIGDNVRIGAGSVVLRDVPADCTVVGVPGRVVYRGGERVDPLEHNRLPDSEAEVIRALLDRIESLEQQMESLKRERAQTPHLSGSTAAQRSLVAAVVPSFDAVAERQEASAAESGAKCRLSDRVIEEFLNGAGI
ncbi:serine O-acetyltransferase [Thermoleptolyngbya sp. C42_A2020_037]|uniref:serine O-acetyltransferase n=1 Tax=Thermoleptolyngbya sp. C42_A2020_037 TaxID=2747799 RepID=UPI0019E6BCA7|nr:serine O-acetyltransferase [Thermoleptolyngbya sp. C42_A2020_037]MBF2083270.1 serine O-acetyltransferase [Thermoleptolyngbya sp. C42_A2020_037]